MAGLNAIQFFERGFWNANQTDILAAKRRKSRKTNINYRSFLCILRLFAAILPVADKLKGVDWL